MIKHDYRTGTKTETMCGLLWRRKLKRQFMQTVLLKLAYLISVEIYTGH